MMLDAFPTSCFPTTRFSAARIPAARFRSAKFFSRDICERRRCRLSALVFVRACAAMAVAALGAVTFAGAASAAGDALWSKHQNPLHGFVIAYPATVFTPSPKAENPEGRLFVSNDGKAKLLVGAFANESDVTLAEYRKFLMESQYAGADIHYAPLRQRWFVLSGTKNGEMFYQRVSFTCQGKLINSWAMLYPVSDAKVYDRLVEGIAKRFTPGEGRTGDCD